VPLARTVYDRVMRTQQVDVHELAEGAEVRDQTRIRE
jgi:hypothetical protein